MKKGVKINLKLQGHRKALSEFKKLGKEAQRLEKKAQTAQRSERYKRLISKPDDKPKE